MKRIYELAKQLKVKSKDILAALDSLGITGKTTSSPLTEEEVKKTIDRLENPMDKKLGAAVVEPPPTSMAPPKPKPPKKKEKPVEVEEVVESEEKPIEPPKEEKKTTHPPSVVELPSPPVDPNSLAHDVLRQEVKKRAKRRRKPDVPKKKEVEAERAVPISRRGVSTKGKSKKAIRREKRERFEQSQEREAAERERLSKTLKITELTTVDDIASSLNIDSSELIATLIGLGLMVTKNQRLDMDTVHIIAEEYGFEVEIAPVYMEDIFAGIEEEEDKGFESFPRPPVVTVMGHVDHGKTKLLDAIRKTNVVASEAGGITQHIGAYEVVREEKKICFLDTPGHEAFTQMRAQGAQVTDIVILVVAATDGVMPQTIEAINHSKAAEVPIIVAINKIDLEGANPDRVKQELAQHGLTPEDWGGKTTMCHVSALKQQGIDELLELVLLQAEMMELSAKPKKRARGTVIEAKIDRSRGSVATLLVQDGTLRVGDIFVTGVDAGKVRAMFNDRGENVQEAPPSTPVEVIGLGGLPSAGDVFTVVKEEKTAKQISAKLQHLQRERALRRTNRVTLADLHKRIEEGDIKEINLIIKADVQGSVAALCESFLGLSGDKVKVRIIHSGAGKITGSDVMLASASDALIIGFHIQANDEAVELSKKEKVEIRTYEIIYDAINEVKAAMEGLLESKFEEVFVGRCEVRDVFRISKIGVIAGSYITDGKMIRNSLAKIIRKDEVVYEGKINSLKRFKDDVREVAAGYECGVGLENFSDIQSGDKIECYTLKEVAQTL